MFLLAGGNLNASGESRATSANSPSVIYLMPTSAAAAERLPDLQRYFHDALHLDLQVLPIFTPGPSGWDGVRRQRSADDLVQQIIEHEESRLHQGRTLVIAVTDEDLYNGSSDWSYGRWSAAKVAVVSYVRMDPRSYGLESNPALLAVRLRRVVARYLGKLYYELPWATDASSPLYSELGSIEGIDRISDDLAAAGFFSARPLVEEWSPVDTGTGQYQHSETDFRIEDTPTIKFDRVYRSDGDPAGPFGVRTSHTYGAFVLGDPTSALVKAIFENGWIGSYRLLNAGAAEKDAVFVPNVPDEKPSTFLNSRLSWKGDAWLLELASGSSYRFSACSATSPKSCSMSSYTDRDGHETRVRFNARGEIEKIEGEHHHAIEFRHDTHGHIVLAWDDEGTWMTYQYDARGRLTKSAFSEGENTYAYDVDGHMVSARVGPGADRMRYDAHGRCIHLEREHLDYVDAAGHVFAHTDVFDFAYTLDDDSPNVRQTIVTGADGLRILTFNPKGYVLTDDYAPDSRHAQRTVYDRDPSTSSVQGVTVSCRVDGQPASATAEIHAGQNQWAVVTRARRACDVKATRAAATSH